MKLFKILSYKVLYCIISLIITFKMVSPQSDDEQFEFYLKFAKPLVLNLSDTNDRIKAAAWIRKLKDETDNATLRTDYLKLLLFVLQRRKLIGPFAVIPDGDRPLQPFPEEINLQDVAKNFVEIDKKVLKEAIEKGGFGEWPPYNVACSTDLKEYAASQDIPNFGVHVYFAISKDPIHNWEQKNKAIFPIGEKIESSNEFGLSTNISPNISSFVSEGQTALPPDKSPMKREGGDGSPASLERQGTLPSTSESNTTPTWGSNLMKVNDSVLDEDFKEKDFDFNIADQDMLDLDDEDIDLDEIDGISDLEDSFYLEGDTLKSPVRTPRSSPAPSLPYRTPPIPSVNLPSPAPSLPYRTPPVPTVNLPSPAPSLPYRTPPRSGTPNDFLFDTSGIDNVDMLDYTDQSINLVEDDDMFFDEVAMYLQSDYLQSPSKQEPCESCEGSLETQEASYGSPPMQGRTPTSPAPSLPYRTPPIPTVNLPSPAPSLPYRTPPKSRTPNDFLFDTSGMDHADMLDYTDQSIKLVEDEDMFFDEVASYLQSDQLQSPSNQEPCEPCESPAPSSPYRTPPMQSRALASPAPSLPYRTPPIPTVNLPSPAPSLPYRTPPKPGTSYDGGPGDADMLDYINESMELIEDVSFGDAAMYLQTDRLTTPPKQQYDQSYVSGSPVPQSPAPSLPYRTPPMPCSSQSHSPPQQPCQARESSPYRPTLDSSEEEELRRLEREIFEEMHSRDMDHVRTPEYSKRIEQLERQLDTSPERLGGDSFIAPESKDFRWLQGVSPGPGLPEDTQQDPDLWESFGWWTEDPNEIFEYIPPSPRVCGSPDPYAEERERWADVPATPPIFSRDPAIQTGPGAQRIYAIEEFGMESFEEPVWTSAEQYMKYMPDSPYQDPRDINRQTLDLAQYNRSPEMKNQLFDMERQAEADYFVAEEQLPIDDLEVSFQEQDFQKMTRAQAAFEAIQHGPVRIGAPPSPPPPPLEDQVQPEEAFADVEFLAKTPPKFVFEPQFFSTPPRYQPNTSINVDDLDETISKYVEDEIKFIQSNIPVTTPQRSPSPKRKKRFIGNETLPNIEDVVLDDDIIARSPELKTPPRYHASPKREIDWDTEIGEVRKVSPLKPAYLGIPDDERQAKSAKRKKELATMYQKQFASPPLVQSPETPPHLIDEAIPGNLGSPLPPQKLPPPGWSWQSPPSSQIPSFVSRNIRTPTGLTPPKKMPEDVTMFYESPPHEIYSPPPSPSSAIGALQFSPPAQFDKPPSPVRSPGGRPIFADWQPTVTADDIDMEEVFPIPYEDLIVEEFPDLYTSPHRIKSPEVLKELDMQTANLSPTSKQMFYDAEIEALENELFKSPTPCGSCSRQQSPGSPVTPEYERRMWKESLKLHDLNDYRKKQWIVRPKPGKTKAVKRYTVGSRLSTIPDQDEPSSPPKLQQAKLQGSSSDRNNRPAEETFANIEAEVEKLRRAEREALQTARQREADLQVKQDIAELSRITYRSPPKGLIYRMPGVDPSFIERAQREFKEMDDMIRKIRIEHRVREQIQSQFASPPRSTEEPVIHPFDEPLPEDAELPPALLPPSGWSWQTPPKYKMTDYKPREKRTPTGLATPDIMSEDVTMFYESPPHELLSPSSPSAATSAIQHTPAFGFNLPSSPIRSPGGRPITESWQIDNIVDEIDFDKVYPGEFEDIDEEEIPELYMSPPKTDQSQIGQELSITFPKTPHRQLPRIPNRPLSPVTPEQERQMWKEKLRLHELRDYWKKQWTVRPKPGKSRKVRRFTPRPALHTIPDERERDRDREHEREREHEHERERVRGREPIILRPRIVTDESTLRLLRALDEEMAEIDRKVQARQEVMKDISDLPQVITATPPKRLTNDPNFDMELFLRQLRSVEKVFENAKLDFRTKERVREQFASPPRMPSPEPVIHPLDEPLSEELELPPALLPPSGWTWQTPPKYKLPDYKPREKYSPKVMSPNKPFSEDVTMFYESPPRELLSPTSPTQIRSPQDFSPPCQSPIGSTYGAEEDIYLENIMPIEYELIDEEDDPQLYVSPTKDKSPKQSQQQATTPTKQQTDMSIEDQIAALECECFGERIKTPTKKVKPNAAVARSLQHSPETPEFKRQLFRDSLRLHEFDKEEQYPKRQWVVQPKPSRRVRVPRHTRKPKLQTILDEKEPSPIKVKREDIIRAEKKMQESRRIYEEAQKQAMLDVLKLQELAQSSVVRTSPRYQGFTEEQKAKMKEDIARRVREQFSSPPRDIQSEPVITHPFDEELPPDLPSALLPPSGWAWKTPPRFQHQPFVEHRIVSPTGVSPPQQIDPESLLYESPPHLTPEEDLDGTCMPCSPIKSPKRSPLQSPKEKLGQTPRKTPVKSPKRLATSPRSLPAFSPIKSPVYTQFEDIDQEYPPEELNILPSSPLSSDASELISDEDYMSQIDAEMNAIEDAMIQSVQKRNVSPGTPPTPEHARKIWQQELALRSPLQLQQRSWVVKPKPGKAYRVRKSKKPDLSPVKEKYLEWSPEVVFESPVRSPAVSPQTQPTVATPTRQQEMPPENWTWKTPSPQTLKTTRQRLFEEGVIPFSTITDDLLSSPEIFSESPPHIPQTPPDTSPIDVCSPCSGVSPPQLTPEFHYSPGSESPVLSPNISPDISPYRSPLRSPGGRPIVPEWAQAHDDDFYFSEILPDQDEYVDEEMPPEEIYEATLPPTPPPLPAAPKPYHHQIRLSPRSRPKPDISVFSPERSPTRSPDRVYQSLASPCRRSEPRPMGRGKTPESAKRPYEPFVEAVRFEPKRPTPPPPVAEYQTPNRAQFRGSRRRRHINRDAPRRRLVFDDEEDFGDIQNLQTAMETSVPSDTITDVYAESPPRDVDISVLSDFDYEPQEFNIFQDENTEEYNVRLPFEGQRYHTQDGSPIPVIDAIAEEERDFRWMPCSSNCQNTPKR